MQRCVESTRAVTYCHCCTWIFSYAGIICAVPIRRKRSLDRSDSKLEFMAPGWMKDEDSHVTLLALLHCLYGHMQIVVV